MKKLIYTLAVNKEKREVDDAGIHEVTKQSWLHYCEKYDIDFYVIDKPQFDVGTPHWFRYFIFDLKPDYDRYLYIDSDIIVHWNAPDIFEQYKDLKKLYVVRDNSGLSWIWESITAYKQLFEDIDLDWERYFNSGVQLFDQSHKDLFQSFKQFYIDNAESIFQFQKQVRKGFDQTPFNYFNAYNETDIEFMSEKYNLVHMVRKEILQNYYFIDMGWFWHFNGIPRDFQDGFIKQLWEKIKKNYVKTPDIDLLIESINEDKHVNLTTTSDQFKRDVWDFFKDFKDQICVEFGTHKGQTTKILSSRFKKVYTININEDSLTTAKKLNADIDNIEYIPFDLYSSDILDIKGASVFMIDAGHKYKQVVSDIERCLSMITGDKCYIIFDDYGFNTQTDVKKAVDEYISSNKIKIVKEIGHQKGHDFGDMHLLDSEGLICEVVK